MLCPRLLIKKLSAFIPVLTRPGRLPARIRERHGRAGRDPIRGPGARIVNLYGIDATKHLPDHDALLDAILGTFDQTPGVIGCFLSGSTATGQMDVDSDLDVGVVFESAEAQYRPNKW